jgi:hypothetical protein
MEALETARRIDVIKEAVDTLQRHFGNRLQAFYALPDDPFEPEGDDRTVYLVAVLSGEMNPLEENKAVAQLMHQLAAEMEFIYTVMVYVAGTDDLSRRAQVEGVRL